MRASGPPLAVLASGQGSNFVALAKAAAEGRLGGRVALVLSDRADAPVLARADWLGRPLGLPYFPLTPSFPWLGPLGVVPLPTRWSIEFGEPLDVQPYGPEGADDPILVNRLAEQVRSTIQGMIDGRLARRRSVFFG